MVLAVAGTLTFILFLSVYLFVSNSINGNSLIQAEFLPSPSRLLKFRTAVVSSDTVSCSKVGRNIMLEGGNAVDAAVATLFCTGVVNPQIAGIGGGFLMTIYNSTSGSATCLNAREAAPLETNRDMFQENAALAYQGPLSVAVPGELAGSWAAHQAYGRLRWSRLVLPAARMAERGVKVNKRLAQDLLFDSELIKSEPSLSTFLNETTGQVLREGDLFYRPIYANTLYKIAEHGADILYNGPVGDHFIEDIQKRGGILNKGDLLNYEADWTDPIKLEMQDNLTLYTNPLPGSGVLLAFILNILDGHLPRKGYDFNEHLFYHRTVEAFKFAFAQRAKLGDPVFERSARTIADFLISKDFASATFDKIDDELTFNNPHHYGTGGVNPDDDGSSHISVLDRDGLAVSVTASVNRNFGAGFASEQTGIILNDQMSDFSNPNTTGYYGALPGQANFIKPGKRPLTSMAPTIVANRETGAVRMVIGGAGGTKIPTAISHVMIRNLWYGDTLKQAVDSPRFHHQLYPMTFTYEDKFPEAVVNNMSLKGHSTKKFKIGSTITGITVEEDGLINANIDFRNYGEIAGIDPSG